MKIFIIIALMMSFTGLNAQTATTTAPYSIVNGKMVSNKAAKKKAAAVETDLVYTDKKGVDHKIYKGPRGGHFCYMVSRKSGKKYKKYFKTK